MEVNGTEPPSPSVNVPLLKSFVLKLILMRCCWDKNRGVFVLYPGKDFL
jgi:hypothetical protein